MVSPTNRQRHISNGQAGRQAGSEMDRHTDEKPLIVNQ
jgi:hypothetical protein